MDSIFDSLRTIQDYQKADQEFQARKQLLQAQAQKAQFEASPEGRARQDPAALRINSYINELLNKGTPEAISEANRVFALQRSQAYGVDTFPMPSNAPQNAPSNSRYPSLMPNDSVQLTPNNPLPPYGNNTLGRTPAEAAADMAAPEPRPVVLDTPGNTLADRLANAAALKKGREEQAKADVQLATGGQIESNKELGKVQGATKGKDVEKAYTASMAIPQIENAVNLLGQASGGGASALWQGAKGFLGVSDATTQVNSDLAMLSGYLTSNVPRMQGPQSDKDVVMYKEMAGSLGDKTKPVADRLAVANTMLKMQAYYSNNPEQMAKYPGWIPGSNPLTGNKQTPTGNDISANISRIPMKAIQALRADPTLASEFDAKYGAGVSKKIMGR